MLLICSCPLAQCRYFYITHRARAHVNPDPVYVCADVLLPKSREDRNSGLSFDDEERLFHVRSLARTLASMYKDIKQIRGDAEKLHTQEKARQAEQARGRAGSQAEELERAASVEAVRLHVLAMELSQSEEESEPRALADEEERPVSSIARDRSRRER